MKTCKNDFESGGIELECCGLPVEPATGCAMLANFYEVPECGDKSGGRCAFGSPSRPIVTGMA